MVQLKECTIKPTNTQQVCRDGQSVAQMHSQTLQRLNPLRAQLTLNILYILQKISITSASEIVFFDC